MANDDHKSLDIFGIRPVADAVSSITKAAVDGASAFLGRICLPAAEEFGQLLQDKVRVWRARNAVALLGEAQTRLDKHQTDRGLHAHPRLVAAALEQGTWSDDKTIQEMWGGLLASSCTPDGRDEGNLIFTNLLSQLTSLQARVLNFACEKTEKEVSPTGLISPTHDLRISVTELRIVAGVEDIHRLDTELDRLRGLGLITDGFSPEGPLVGLTATALAMNMYVKCQGFPGTAAEYFKLSSSRSD